MCHFTTSAPTIHRVHYLKACKSTEKLKLLFLCNRSSVLGPDKIWFSPFLNSLHFWADDLFNGSLPLSSFLGASRVLLAQNLPLPKYGIRVLFQYFTPIDNQVLHFLPGKDYLEDSPCPILGEYVGMIPNADNLCAKLSSDCTSPDTMYYSVSDCSQTVYEGTLVVFSTISSFRCRTSVAL